MNEQTISHYVLNASFKRVLLQSVEPLRVASGQIVATEEINASRAALKWFDFNVGEAKEFETKIGRVIIDRRSIKDSLNHKYGQRKLDAVTSLINGFKGSVYLTSLKDFKDLDIINHFFSYPIEYDGELCFVICRIRTDSNQSRLYVHEVFPENIIKGDTLQTAASKDQYRRGIALYWSILHEVLNCKDNENYEPSKEK